MAACPKLKNGTTLREEREQKRAARDADRRATDRPPVVSRGPTARRRAKKARVVTAAERAAKDVVRHRDRVCRWPGCECNVVRHSQYGGFWCQLEVAHLEHKGAGGDPEQIRTQPHLMILLCKWRHQGPFGLDAGRLDIRPLTDRGTDGQVECWKREGESDRWFFVGTSSPPERMPSGAEEGT